MALHVEVVSPERTLFEGDATMVQARTLEGGDLAFLTGHAPFIGALDIHTVVIALEGGGEEIVAVHGGFVSCVNDHLTVLSDQAELASQIDADRARTALERAEEAIRRGDDVDAEAALRRAQNRLTATGNPPD